MIETLGDALAEALFDDVTTKATQAFPPELRRAAPKDPFHPGEILREELLEPAGISQAAFAAQIGWTRSRLNELIKGKRGVTAAAALDLADALGTSAKLWMNLEATYDLAKAAKAREVA